MRLSHRSLCETGFIVLQLVLAIVVMVQWESARARDIDPETVSDMAMVISVRLTEGGMVAAADDTVCFFFCIVFFFASAQSDQSLRCALNG